MKGIDNAMAFHADLLSRPGYGINSPIVRQLQSVIKIAYGRDGVNAIQAARLAAAKNAGPVNTLIKKQPQEQPKKPTSLARLQRVAGRAGEQDSPALGKSRREMRNRLRGELPELQTRKRTLELEVEAKNVVEDEEVVQPTLANIEGPLLPTEVKEISIMSAKEIVDRFGEARIDATLESIGEKEPTGSERQKANRLKKKLLEA